MSARKLNGFTLVEALAAVGIIATLVALLVPVASQGCSQSSPHRYEVTIIRPDGQKHETIFHVSRYEVHIDTLGSSHWKIKAEPWGQPLFHLPAGWTARIIDHGPVAEQE